MPRPKPDKDIAKRIAAKKASRRKDRVRVQEGKNLEKIQRENSILPADFFSKGEISNFAEAVGR